MSFPALIIARSPAASGPIIRRLRQLDMFGPFHVAADLQQALAVMHQAPVMMIFSELPYSTRATLELARKLQEREEWAEIPLLAFLREETLGLRLLALELGAGDCLPLTAPIEELKLRCRHHLAKAERIRALRLGQARLARLALTDGLTGIFNRAYFDATLEQEIARRDRSGQPLALLLIDLDHFKWINDSCGHSAGDQALRDVAQALAGSFRKADTVCRYGGEEFAVILPETAPEQAYLIAERARLTIARLPRPVQVTASLGLGWAIGAEPTHPQILIDRADQALYAAKADGRNRTSNWARRDAPAAVTSFQVAHHA